MSKDPEQSHDLSEPNEDPSSIPPDTVLKTFGVYNTGTRVNFRIHQGGSKDPVVYYVNNSTFVPGTPDVQLRKGDSKDGPIAAFGKFHNLKAHVTLGLGDPGSKDVVYEELHKESKVAHSEYVFSTTANSGSDHRKYVWRRTLGKGGFANYACLDGASGQLVAYFVKTGVKSMKKVGRLCVTSKITPEMEMMLLVTWLSIREKENRNAWYTAGIISSST